MSSGRGLPERSGAIESPHAQLQDVYRRLNNVIRVGTVIDADYQSQKIRVQIGEGDNRTIVTSWLSYPCQRSGHDRHTQIPELHEQVILVCPSGRLESAMIIGSLGYAKFPDSASDPNHDLKLMRVLENTEYWTAKEERKAVGDVNPEAKTNNAKIPLATVPEQQKTLPAASGLAGILEYYYSHVIRPEIEALIEHVAATTGENGEANMQLVASAQRSGIAQFLLEAGVIGEGTAQGYISVLAGDSSFDTEGNPNKPNQDEATGEYSRAKLVTEVVNKKQGDAVHDEVIHSSGRSVKSVDILGDGSSELIINLHNAPNFQINIGSSQTITGDGNTLTLTSPQTEIVSSGSVNVTADSVEVTGKTVKITGDSVDLNGSVKINGVTQVMD